MDIQIQTYWNVETLYFVFNAVAAMMTGASFSGLLKLVFLFAIGIGMFGYMNKQLEMAKWFIHALAFVTLLNLPIAKVILFDKTGFESPRTVDHVPFALAVVAQTTNLVFGALTHTYETVFGVPEDLGLQQGDVGFGHRILKQVNHATIRDPSLRADLMQFIKECTLYDVKDGQITPQQVVGGTDTWHTIFNNTNPARFVTYDTLSNTLKTDTCTNVAKILQDRVNQAVVAGQVFYGKQVFTRATSDGLAASLFISTVGTSYDWILNNASHASDAMKQAMFNNIWKEAASELPALLNDPARVSEVNVLAGAAHAARQADGSNSTLSLLAQETLPHVRNWIEAMLYGLFPVVVVFMVISSTEGAKRIISGYLMSLAWIGLWPILFAIINHLSLIHLRYKARALELAEGVPFQLMDAFDATLANEQAAIGYLVVLVPFIAGGIIRLGQSGLIGVADRMMSSFASSGATVGANMASGNLNIGQTGLDTAAVNSTSMHKFDTHIGLQGSGMTIGRADGTTAIMTANGTVALHQLQNRMRMQMSLDDRHEVGANQEAHRTKITSRGYQSAYRDSQVSTLTDVQGHDMTRGTYQNQGVLISTASEGGQSGQHVVGQHLDHRFQERSHFQMSAGVNDQINMNMGLGASYGNRVSSPGRGQGISDARNQKRIANAMEQGGARPIQIDQALNRYRDSQHPGQSTSPSTHAGLGYHGTRTYTAGHGRDRGVDTMHGYQETARMEQTFSERSAHRTQSGIGDQSAQNDRHAREATLNDVDDLSHIHDVSDRHEYGIGDRTHRSESHALTAHKDLMADPYLFEKVAARHHMTAMRFASQSESRIMQMVQDYVVEKSIVQQASTLPQQTQSGEKLPTTHSELGARSTQNHADIQQPAMAAMHKKKVAQSGYTRTTPFNAEISPSPVIAESKRDIESQLDPNNKTSLPARAADLDENVHAWASPDKKIGEGRANPAALTQDAMLRDGKDTVLKVFDKLTGGDGTADGEKLNDNKKRETAASVKINKGKNR